MLKQNAPSRMAPKAGRGVVGGGGWCGRTISGSALTDRFQCLAVLRTDKQKDRQTSAPPAAAAGDSVFAKLDAWCSLDIESAVLYALAELFSLQTAQCVKMSNSEENGMVLRFTCVEIVVHG